MSSEAVARAALAATGVREESLVARHGWTNQAWIGARYVVRVSSGRLRGSFVHEAAVVDALKGAGVAVPAVVAAGRVASLGPGHRWIGKDSEWIVSRRVDGCTLAAAWPTLSSAQRRQVGNGLGETLRLLHAYRVAAIAPEWWRDAQSNPAEIHNAYRPPVAFGGALVAAAGRLPQADHAVLDDVADLLEHRRPLFAADTDVFVHGDVHGHNIMITRDATISVSALLDWEGAHHAAPDVELDMLLRYLATADRLSEQPGTTTGISPGDAIELAAHVAETYPALFEGRYLRQRLETYDAHWHLVQLLAHSRLNQPAAQPDPHWHHLRQLVAGHSHLDSYRL